MCLCVAAPQVLSVTGGLTGPHQPKGSPAPSMGGWKHLSGAGDVQPRVSFQFPGPPQHAPPQPC